MKINEGYNLAAKKYGKQIADQMYRAGIPKSFIDTACRFYTKDGVPIETLQDDFKKWNRYVLNNPSFTAQGNNNLNVFKSYLDFKRELQRAMKPFICPNPIYDDGNLSIGELKTQRDARWFPIQNLASPDDNNDYCVSRNEGGYQQFQKYRQLGYKMLIIYDKSKPANDEFKRAFVIARDGHLDFWNNYDEPCGTTKKNDDPIWRYIDTLPHEAQIALSKFAESTLSGGKVTESKTSKNMKKTTIRLNESQLRKVIAESVKKALNEYYENVNQINLDKTGEISDYELFDNGNANYYFTTEEPSSNNSDTMSRFLSMVYESDGGIEWSVDGSQAFARRNNGTEIQIDASGNGDYIHHLVSVMVISGKER